MLNVPKGAIIVYVYIYICVFFYTITNATVANIVRSCVWIVLVILRWKQIQIKTATPLLFFFGNIRLAKEVLLFFFFFLSKGTNTFGADCSWRLLTFFSVARHPVRSRACHWLESEEGKYISLWCISVFTEMMTTWWLWFVNTESNVSLSRWQKCAEESVLSSGARVYFYKRIQSGRYGAEHFKKKKMQQPPSPPNPPPKK